MVSLLVAKIDHELVARVMEYFNIILPDYNIHNGKSLNSSAEVMHLCGRFLLCRGLNDLGYPTTLMEHIQKSMYGKPYVENGPRFNISHSRCFVVCAVSDFVEIGVDIEYCARVEISEFEHIFSPGEWSNISACKDSLGEFYRYWTRKEALLKAIGTGLNDSLSTFEVLGEKFCYEGNWYFTDLLIEPDYKCCLVSNVKLELHQVQVLRT